MQLKIQSLILLVVICLLPRSVHGAVTESNEIVATNFLETRDKEEQQEQNDNKKKIANIIKILIKGIKHVTLALLGAGSVIAGTEYIWWKLSRYLGSEERKTILFQQMVETKTRINEFELKIERIEKYGQIDSSTYRSLRDFIAQLKSNGNPATLKNTYYSLLNTQKVYRSGNVEILFSDIEKIIAAF